MLLSNLSLHYTIAVHRFMQNPLLHIVAWQGHSRDPGQVQPRALIRTKQAHWQEIKQPYWQVQKTSASKVHPSIVTLDAAPTQSQCCFLAYLTLAPLVTCIAPTLPQHLPLPKQWMETVWNCFHTASTQSQHSLHAARTQVQCSWNISARSPHAATKQGLGLEVWDWRKSRWFGDWKKHLGFGRNYRQARKRCSPHKHTYSGPEDHVSEPAQSQLEAPNLPLAGGLLVAVRGQESAGWG